MSALWEEQHLDRDFKGLVQLFWKYVESLSCRELDEIPLSFLSGYLSLA